MTLGELIASFREDAQDHANAINGNKGDTLWSDETLARFFTEAEAEAAIRGRLLHESALPAMCQIATMPGTDSYRLDPRLYEITHLSWGLTGVPTDRRALNLVSVEDMDRGYCDWRTRTGRPEFAIQTERRIRLAGVQTQPGTLYIEGYRTPLRPLEDDDDEPEIHPASHRFLVYWALHRAFSKVDAEAFDPTRAALALNAFESYFGLRPDADLRRTTRHDVPHHNLAIWP